MPSASGRAGPEDQGLRVDRFISERLQVVTRSQLAARVEQVAVNGNEVKLSRTLRIGDLVHVTYTLPQPTTVRPEKIDLAILFENSDVIVVNKPAGMVVHPAAGNYSGTLVQGLLHHVSALGTAFADDQTRPGIVHRLDKDTSGVIIAAKNPEAHHFLAEQFRTRATEKVYLAVVKGRPRPAAGTLRGYIRRDPTNRKRFAFSNTTGKPAETHYQVLRTAGPYSLVRLTPKTGRTHQLRVHMAHVGSPIVGDALYARARVTDAGRMLLHAFALRIRLPREAATRTFRAPLPRELKDAVQSPLARSSAAPNAPL
jgi:23S rRNA pseudouridine1911/1915/1917 synthase